MRKNRKRLSRMTIELPLILMARAMLAAYIIFSLVACAQSASTTQISPTPHVSPTTTAQPQPTTPAQETVLFQADWSRGLADWRGARGWKVVGGQLLVNSPSETTFIVPYMPKVANYAIEVQVQVVHVLEQTGAGFLIVADKAPGKDGYQAGFNSLAAPPPSEDPAPNFYAGFAQVVTDDFDPGAGFNSMDFVPGTNWRTYRVEVRGNQASFAIDGTYVSRSTSREAALSNGPLSLDIRGLLLRMSSFRITALPN